ncbi:hypothetical protein H4R33_002739 [Dimargaris cristalligena]|nr:hypothetical protein H4R33_002739 [Dimargaris cristalligena]
MELAGYHEVGHRARWSVSSARVDLGAEHLYDNDLTTFWQTAVKIVALYMDYQQDESYTPNSISVVGGNSITDLQKIITHNFKEPDGWVQFDPLVYTSLEFNMASRIR